MNFILSNSVVRNETSNDEKLSMNHIVDMTVSDFIEILNNINAKIDVKRLTDAIAEDERIIEQNKPINTESIRMRKSHLYFAERFTAYYFADNDVDAFKEHLKNPMQVDDSVSYLETFNKQYDEDFKNKNEHYIQSFANVLLRAVEEYQPTASEKKKKQTDVKNVKNYAFDKLTNFANDLIKMNEMKKKSLQSVKEFDKLMYEITHEKKVA